MTRRPVNVGALDVAHYVGSPAHPLAVVVHRETEVERAAASLAFRQEHGDTPVQTNALAALLVPFDHNKSRPWFEYLTFAVVDRCAVALDITAGALLGRVVSDLHPANWEMLFWQGAYHRAIEDSSLELVDAEMKLEEQAERFEAQRQANAKAGGHASHARQYGKAKAFVLAEWAMHKGLHGGNRAAFARVYVDRVKRECGAVVTHKTIASIWLKGQ